MELISTIKFETIQTKDNREFIKSLLITADDNNPDTLNVYTLFNKSEGAISNLLMTPGYEISMSIISVSYAGSYNKQSRYAVTFEFLDVDTKPQIVTLIYNKVY